MKAHYRTRNGQITIEVSGELVKDLVREIAAVQIVFEAEAACGCCSGTDIRYQHRKEGKFDYYEMVCNNMDCRARFSFGQNLEGGTLFPKRRQDGKNLPNRGWSKYDPSKKENGEKAA